MKSNTEHSKHVDVLAFSPHPDDAEFGCGGLLALAASKGLKTAIIDMSESELSTNGDVATRYKEAEAARKTLGVTHRENLQIPNNKFYNSEEVQKKLVRILRAYRPKMLLIPYDYDRHPDHENASRLVREAVFSSGLVKYECDGLAPHRPTRFYYYSLWIEFEPSFLLDVTPVWNKKRDAIFKAYKSQFSTTKNTKPTIDTDKRMHKFIEARARHLGFQINTEYAEAYKSVYFPIGVEDPFTLLPNLF